VLVTVPPPGRLAAVGVPPVEPLESLDLDAVALAVEKLHPEVNSVIELGGQDAKIIVFKQDAKSGRKNKFASMNDKCAGGTGRFLEMIADVLQMPLEEIGSLSLESTHDLPFSTVCAVFAKSEALALLKKGAPKSDILSGLHDAIAVRCRNLLKRVSIEKDFTITGGIAKNIGMVNKVKEKVGLEPLLAPDPQIIGALGAALFAQERARAQGGSCES
jgi:predicted CoA-substrate-specific enzyme activase